MASVIFEIDAETLISHGNPRRFAAPAAVDQLASQGQELSNCGAGLRRFPVLQPRSESEGSGSDAKHDHRGRTIPAAHGDPLYPRPRYGKRAPRAGRRGLAGEGWRGDRTRRDRHRWARRAARRLARSRPLPARLRARRPFLPPRGARRRDRLRAPGPPPPTPHPPPRPQLPPGLVTDRPQRPRADFRPPPRLAEA